MKSADYIFVVILHTQTNIMTDRTTDDRINPALAHLIIVDKLEDLYRVY